MSTSTVPVQALLQYPQAAEHLGISVLTLKRIIANGDLKKVKIGSRVFIRASDLNAYIESLTDDPTPIRKSS